MRVDLLGCFRGSSSLVTDPPDVELARVLPRVQPPLGSDAAADRESGELVDISQLRPEDAWQYGGAVVN